LVYIHQYIGIYKYFFYALWGIFNFKKQKRYYRNPFKQNSHKNSMKRSSRRWKKKGQMRWKWQRKRLRKEKHKRKLKRARSK
jgi:large subunit ribosomal protein L41e